MRIGMVLDKPFPVDDRVEKEAKTLIEAGYEVHLLCFTFGKLPKIEFMNGIRIYRVFMSHQIYKKLSALILTLPFYNWFWKKHIQNFIAENKIDALHIHDLPICGISIDIAKKLKIPLVADMHENYPMLISESRHSNTLLGRILISKKKWFQKEKVWLEKINHIIVVADEMKQRLQAILPPRKNYTVVPNTIQMADFLDQQKKNPDLSLKYKDDFVVLYYGGLGRLRGIETMIKAAAQLKGKIKRLKMVIVGIGSIIDELKTLATNRKVEKIICFEGWQNQAVLNAYMENTQVCVLPHIKSVQTDNSSPNKLFIYMMFKKPVIASNCNSIQKIIEEYNCGLIFKNDDSDHLARQILELYNNSTTAKQMGENGYQAVQNHFNWTKTSQPLIDLYQKIEMDI